MAFVKKNAQFLLLVGGLGTATGGSQWMTSAKIDNNDLKQREQRRIERVRRDSIQTASDSIAALKDDLILSKLDKIIARQRQH